MLKLITPFAVVLLALGAAIYFDDTPGDAELVFVNRSDVFTLDPQRMSYVQDFRMAYALYEGLVRWNNSDFTIQPALAAVPETGAGGDAGISDDRLRYEFHLRKDAKWSNGAPVTADDFVYSWRRLILPDTAADYSNLFFVIKGARAFWDWRNEQLAAIEADPWSSSPNDVADHARKCHDRLMMMLNTKKAPAGLAMPAADRGMCRSELEMLDRLLREFAATDQVAARLASMTHTRQWFDQLRSDASRAAEVECIWARTAAYFEETVGIEAVDAHTLVVTLETPCAYFLDLVAFSLAYPVYRPCVEGWPRAAAEAAVAAPRGWVDVDAPELNECRWIALDPFSGRIQQKHQWARPGELISNGPYVLTQWRYKRDIRLERNDMYHTPEMAISDAIVARAIEDTNTAVLAFESGHIDWLTDVSAEYQSDMLVERQRYIDAHRDRYQALLAEGASEDEALARLPLPRSGERRNIHKFPTFGTDFYSFNCRPALPGGLLNPFADRRIRAAFVLATNKTPIVESATRLGEPIRNTLVPIDSIPGYDNPEGLSYDPVAALEKLAEAGWSIGEADGLLRSSSTNELFPTVEILWTTNTPRYKWISLELKSQWEKKLGVRVELVGRDTKFYKEDLKKGNFMVARGRWYGDYGDPTTFLDLCRSTDGNNDRGYENPEIDAMLDRAASEIDPEKRMNILEECEWKLFNEELPMLPLCQLVQVYMYEPGRVSGLSHHPRLTQYLWQMKVRQRPVFGDQL